MVPVTHPPEHLTPKSPRPQPDGTRPAPRLIATDLDGTLLRDDKTVSARTIAALAAAEAAGIEVFFVTGRPARWMGVVSDHVHGHGLAICANGAAVVDLHAGRRVVRVRELARRDAVAVVDALRAAAPGVTFAVERTEGIHYEPDYPSFPMDPGASFAPVDDLLTDSSEGHYAQPVVKLLAHHPTMDPDDFLALGRKAAGAHAEFTRSSPSALLEISGRGVSKASTLALACEERGITRDEVVAFGDMPNDLAMLTWAGTSYAMANAHPDVLMCTTYTAASNEEDGVAKAIESFL
ncbi:Cof-type HAD-IIB family hydrolase [Streptomyces albus]|uniref:Cof-type HAD-IIB family hydrolase n=2 Tax=Streptomyces albus TaxID=1888 RepID=A0A6C1C6H2_9ACTN|nr:cof-like hydrolase [Streptomyces sp. HPH0547]KPC96895.1 hydrolase [Streptomyces sp. NRRL F-6602]QID37142.1 Cof-type HAD-IIB family hydrolase [Streptomyces albus]TGG81432.1 Cof-type HAD-IIB family hydrolase [Streptomyces albus]